MSAVRKLRPRRSSRLASAYTTQGAVVFDRAVFTQSQPARRDIKLTPRDHAERMR